MKFASLLLPAVAAVDDDTMMLSMGRMAVDAESSIHSLMEAAGERNVTQMESLMQALVEETIQGDGVEQLDEDIKKALYVIRGNLVEAIRTTLTGEHKVDQDYIMEQLKCFDNCKHGKDTDDKSCEQYDKDSWEFERTHVSCRTKLFAQYVKKIESCGKLDDWVFAFELTPKPVEYCVYDAQYKCHFKECTEASSTCTPEIDGYFGAWLQKIIAEATAGYEIWYRMHLACKAHYHSYIEIDSQCDVVQGKFETSVCAARQCRYSGCTVDYAACRDRCIAEYHRTVKRVECAEKDRKIDWSATEKIECYLRILLASPTNKDLQENCSDKSKCLNEWRTREYNKCNDVCPQVDYDSANGYSQHHRRHGQAGEGLDPDVLLHEGQQAFRQFGDNPVPGDRTHGVNTTHRVPDGQDKKLEKRCTQHLDIDFQPIPCATKCLPPPPSPCEDVFMAKYYHQFLQMTQIDRLSDERKCHEESPGEHTEKWAYNLCDCRECSPCTGTPHNRDDDYCEDDHSCPKIERGSDYLGGGDYKQVLLSSAEKCQALCTWEEKCHSFAYTVHNQVCYLKTGVPALKGNSIVDSGLPCPFGGPKIIIDPPTVGR